MRNYEIMYIIRTTIAEDEVKKVAKSFEKVLTDNGAKITDVNEWGQRELAYEINDNKSGYYYKQFSYIFKGIHMDAEGCKRGG